MNDPELTAEARRVAARLRLRAGALDKLAAEVLKQTADRLDALTPKASVWAFCRRCKAGTMSLPCPRCGGPACSRCGRCPPCDGDQPDEEE